MSIAMGSDKQFKRTHDCSEHYELQNMNKAMLFNCDGCKMNGSGPRFVCDLCDDTLHKVCRYPKLTISHYFFEGAIFTFTETVTGVYKRCSACQKDIRGFSYHCEAKNLDLHPVCYKLERRIYFDNKTFDLDMKLSSECKGCNKSDTLSDNTWSYVSSCKKYNFHAHCFMERVHEFDLKRGDNISSYNSPYLATPDMHSDSEEIIPLDISGNLGQVMHDCHEHQELISTDEEKVVFTCDGCKMDGFGPRYVCNLCDNALHKGCKYPKPVVSHVYFGNSTFAFTKEVTFKVCNACQNQIRGFSYHCEAKHLNLHPECYKLDKKIHFDQRIFNLVNNKPSSPCTAICEMTCNSGWYYVTSCNKYNFHVACFVERMHDHKMKSSPHSSTEQNSEAGEEIDMGSIIQSRLTQIDDQNEFSEDQVLLDLADGGASIFGIKGKTKLCFQTIKLFFVTLYNYFTKGTVKFTVDLVQQTARKLKVRIGNWAQKIMEFLTETLFKIWAAQAIQPHQLRN